MAATAEQIEDIDAALQFWRQGDVTLDAGLEFLHLADLSIPLSPASQHAAKSITETGGDLSADLNALLDEVPGLVMLSQTCDIVRSCERRPFVEVAPLAEMQPEQVEAVRRLRRPAFVYVPAVAARGLVGDLDRIMTVEKSIVAHWQRIPGWDTDDEARSFAEAVARKWARFAYPDDFNDASAELKKRVTTRHDKDHAEGAHLRLSERYGCAPLHHGTTKRFDLLSGSSRKRSPRAMRQPGTNGSTSGPDCSNSPRASP
jgi:hypothetical protein